jgi:putative hydrolase of the HAD superfamily
MRALAGRRPLAVTVDLDDTLFPQREFLDGAWHDVAATGASMGVPERPLLEALTGIASEGSDRGRIIDRALERCQSPASPELVAALVDTFRGYRPAKLAAYPGVPETLARLRGWLPVACVTDGDPLIQRAKLSALGLADGFDAVVISDEIGRQFRKPHPAPFLAALERLGALPADAVHIGDRPDKDVVGPHRLGMRAIRVRTGEYAATSDPDPGPELSCDDAVSAMVAIQAALVS